MKSNQLVPIRFSEYFDLPQDGEYDFVDIYAHQDIPLFLDPFGISAMGTKWSTECENQIATYFQYLIDSIRNGDKKSTSKLLGALHEVDEVGLGYSTGVSKGRGIGKKQAQEIQDAFETSAAAKSGDIKDIADCALMIPGVNRDKISDITANILKRKLIEFTQRQCKEHNIPLKKVPVSAFDYKKFEFLSYYSELPVINGRPKILLPITAVRQDPELSKDKYYRKFVLEFLKAEHEHAGDSLASVLKNGKVIVRIADLKAKYPLKNDFLYTFSKENPQILEKYKAELRRSASTNSKAVLTPIRKILNVKERLEILSTIIPGNQDASRFHDFAFSNLIHIFSDRLSNPTKERTINDGRKRVDIVFDNNDQKGFFHKLNSLYHIQCPKVFVECKNYTKDMKNPELDQLFGRFSSTRGKFGLIVCRSIENKKDIIARCKDFVNSNQSYIIVLEDSDITELLKYRDKKNENGIDNFMARKFDELIM